jgi:hypothetical protein
MIRWGVLTAYSYFQSQDKPNQDAQELKKLFYGDYSYKWAKERMETAIRDYERDNSWPIYGPLLTQGQRTLLFPPH